MNGVPCIRLLQCMETMSLITVAVCTVTHVIRSTLTDIPLSGGCHSMSDFAVLPVLILSFYSLTTAEHLDVSTHRTTLYLWGYIKSCVCLSSWTWSHLWLICSLGRALFRFWMCVFMRVTMETIQIFIHRATSFSITACHCNLSISIIWSEINWWNSGVLTGKTINFSLHVFLMHISGKT